MSHSIVSIGLWTKNNSKTSDLCAVSIIAVSPVVVNMFVFVERSSIQFVPHREIPKTLCAFAGEHNACVKFLHEWQEEDSWTFFWDPLPTLPPPRAYSYTWVRLYYTALKILSTCMRTLCAPSNFHVLIHNPSQTPCLHLPAARAKLSPQNKHPPPFPRTHTHTDKPPSLSSRNNDETWWQCQAGERGSQLYWSAIWGTNGFCGSSSASDGQPDPWDVLAPCSHRLPAPLSLFWETHANGQRCKDASLSKNLNTPQQVIRKKDDLVSCW